MTNHPAPKTVTVWSPHDTHAQEADMTDHDFRALPPGWYTADYDTVEDVTNYQPCLGLVSINGSWFPAWFDFETGGYTHDSGGTLVYRPDLAKLPGDLEVRVIDGVEVIRPEFTGNRRVIAPGAPFPRPAAN